MNRFFPCLLLVCGIFLLESCNSQAQQTAAPNVQMVETIEVHASDVPIYSGYAAQTYARNTVEVRGRVAGYIDKWQFRPGQEVEAGQVLYVLDLRPLQAVAQAAEGSFRQSEADLEFAKNQVSLLQAQANLAVAKANLTKAQQDFDRLKPMVEADAAPKQDLDTAAAALAANEASVRAAQAAVDQAKIQTDTQIGANEGKVESLKGSLDAARLNLDYGTIRAPISGLIGDTQVPVGGIVNPASATPLTTIVPLDPMWARFKISETQYLSFVKSGRLDPAHTPPIQLILADNSTYSFPGKIENALNQLDSRTGTLELQATFPNPKHNLLPGQFGRIRFQTDLKKDVVTIPQRAIVQTQNTQSVYTVSTENKIQLRPVTTGERTGEVVIVNQGLKPGDRVVVEGLLRVQPGMAVQSRPFKNTTGAN
jgi:membrane fusion protein (multidrug efflux system)